MRNALVVVAASFVAFSWDAYGHHVFTITGKTSQGLPPFRPPPTSDTTENGTVIPFGEIVEVRRRGKGQLQHDGSESFFVLPKISLSHKKSSWLASFPLCVLGVQGFGGGLAVIPFMGLLESIAIAKAFGKCLINIQKAGHVAKALFYRLLSAFDNQGS